MIKSNKSDLAGGEKKVKGFNLETQAETCR